MEGFSMAQRSKREYLRSIYKRYRHARKAEKGMMLEEFCKVCGYNRKYAIWLLNRSLPEAAVLKRTLSRSPVYSQAMVRVLAKVWKASGYLCSQRLKAALVHWLPWIRQHLIPIKTDHWDVNTPGYLEIDLVSHSGALAVGEFLHSLDCVDIATC